MEIIKMTNTGNAHPGPPMFLTLAACFWSGSSTTLCNPICYSTPSMASQILKLTLKCDVYRNGNINPTNSLYPLFIV